MKTNFKGTIGEVKAKMLFCENDITKLVIENKEKEIILVTDIAVNGKHSVEAVFNNALIADAFNIRQQINCDLPELLERYNEMLEVLQNVLNNSKVPNDLFYIAKNVVKKSLKTLE